MTTRTLTRELYDSFQKVELDRWDAIVHSDVLINSPVGLGMQGIGTLKAWAQAFASGLAYQIDLIDEHLALDAQGNGRGFITLNLHWKHREEFFGLKPTGREGTSIESLILTIQKNRITRIDVVDHTLDLVLYMWDRGWACPHHVRPPVLVQGQNRSESR